MHSLVVVGNTFPVKCIAYYSDKAPASAFRAYQVIVFDSIYHPPVRSLQYTNKTILGYISLGEVETNRDYFNLVKSYGILLQENKNWPGSYYLDVRDKRWAKLVVEKLIPNILFQGFGGIFIDTLDNPEYLEQQNSTKYKGMLAASINLVKLIRLNYPNITIMLNRAYSVLLKAVDDIDIELGESLYTDYNFDTKTYQLVAPNIYQQQVKILHKALQLNKNLQVFSLDYWYPENLEMIAKIYGIEISNKFSPYVATVGLDEIIARPQNDKKKH